MFHAENLSKMLIKLIELQEFATVDEFLYTYKDQINMDKVDKSTGLTLPWVYKRAKDR